MVSGARNGSIAFWDIHAGKPIKKAQCHEGAVSKILFFDDGADSSLILTAGINDGVI